LRQTYLNLTLLICSLAFSNVARGQSAVPENDIDGVIAQAYDLKNVLIVSVTQKTLYREGDGVAVALAHIVGQGAVNDQRIGSICSLIETAFSYPQLIVNPKNSKPDVSLLLLGSSRFSTSDPAVRNKISALQSHLMTFYK
jgi:hypothetical protein